MRQPAAQNSSGFTLLEVLVAMTIMALVCAAMAPVFHQHARTNTEMEKRTAAVEAAQQLLDNLRFEDVDALPASGAGSTESISASGYAFSVTPYYCVDSTLCTSTSTRHIVAVVNYNGEDIYELETVYTQLR